MSRLLSPGLRQLQSQSQRLSPLARQTSVFSSRPQLRMSSIATFKSPSVSNEPNVCFRDLFQGWSIPLGLAFETY